MKCILSFIINMKIILQQLNFEIILLIYVVEILTLLYCILDMRFGEGFLCIFLLLTINQPCRTIFKRHIWLSLIISSKF